MVSPPLEGIQEFKMITSGFSAEYGRFAGGVLSLISKSDGNRYRGSLYEFLRNDVSMRATSSTPPSRNCARISMAQQSPVP